MKKAVKYCRSTWKLIHKEVSNSLVGQQNIIFNSGNSVISDPRLVS